MQIEIRLIENSMQHAKFQIFQRTLLDFNGTVMYFYFKSINCSLVFPHRLSLVQ